MKYPPKRLGRRNAALCLATVALALTGGMDLAASGRVHLAFFYLGPILLAALGADYLWGMVFAVASTVAGALAGLASARLFDGMGFLAANQLIALGFFGLAVFLAERWRAGAARRAVLDRTDKATGLLRETAFTHHLADEILKLARTQRAFGLLYLDCDDLDAAIATLGKYEADKLQEAVGRALSKAIRRTDKAARMGGREFAVLLWNIAPENVPHIAEKILGSIGRGASGLPKTIAFSVGAVSYSQALPVDSYAQALDAAMQAIEAARNVMEVARKKPHPKVSCAAF